MCKEKCPDCDGKGKIECQECEDCTFCDGYGYYPPGEAPHKTKECERCEGRGKVCDICDKGFIKCDCKSIY